MKLEEVIEGVHWKQERPAWCPHFNCQFKRRVMDSLCGGELPESQPHGSIENANTHRICIQGDPEIDKFKLSLQVNESDLDWFRWVFDALDGRKTSKEAINAE